ncbi:SusC/RagA family TonB-linked outer membrane protein [Flammeovirga kamogawensis]|uniref:TonB-dependent receptor n=1 Tax=Flammeovirga kamogawensis TaxID=373891 RepID=A0ABX8H4N5_9BACT|nr:TonB-dependent receptor [Flammeovirga kamogawensis]MBB6461721.1 TonB-linked SusC/RagA family outer membrane protein [Flammeovirga kamogawensis]QWG10639.1 TonB-dependent receptor [Flammeovirga kamogawensis]TRX63744.1 TonB-dependent receptor [Flammeovirga kamogawensis]
MQIIKNFFLLFIAIIITVSAHAQQRTITGTVTDETDSPLPGVNITIEGTSTGTITDFDGKFKLNVDADDTILQITSIGYVTQKLTVGSQSTIDIKMDVDLEELEEVVVIGYGTAKKSDVTGSVTTVSSDELTVVATEDVNKALQGRVPGVQVTTSSNPAGSSKVRVRGIGTINNSDPLYVVDGFPMQDISHIAPQDIESMEVLKDASATAVYGSRGANGVIIIATKKGYAGDKVTFTFNAQTGVKTAANTIEMANASQYAQMGLEAQRFADGSNEHEQLSYIANGNYSGTDWQDELLRQGSFQNYNLGINGGSDKHQYNISTSYVKDEGVLKGTDLEKFFVKFNNNNKLTNWLEFGQNIAYTHANYSLTNLNDIYQSPLTQALWTDPITPVLNPDGSYARATWSYNNNPARMAEQEQYKRSFDNRIVGNFSLNAKVNKDLTLTSNFGVDYRNQSQKIYLPQYFVSNEEQRNTSQLDEHRNNKFDWVWSNYANYSKSFGQHNIGAMVGMEMQNFSFNNISATGYDVPFNENMRYLGAAKGADFFATSNQGASSLMSYFARANYNYNNKYLFTATLRADGSSKFAEENRWGIFPSFSAGWNMKEENFLSSSEAISQLKLRAGWGEVGNQSSAGNNDYLSTITNNLRYVVNGNVVEGRIPTTMSNPNLRWETAQMSNFGIDAGFLNDKVTLSAEYFIKNTTDMVVPQPVPDYVGANSPNVNVGTMQNKGFEFAINVRNSEHDFKWNVGANIAIIDNKVTDLGETGHIDGGYIDKLGYITRTEENQEIAYFYGYQTDGIFKTQEEVDAHVDSEGNPLQDGAGVGDVRFVDRDGDGIINDNDKTNLGSAIPQFTGSVNLGMEYKGFDLNIFFTGSYGNEIANVQKFWIENSNVQKNQTSNYFNNRFHVDNNPNGTMPRVVSGDPNNNARFSDRYIEDASYLRLQNVQLGYTLNRDLASKIHLERLRIFASADNLFTFTNYSGYDPEVSDHYGDPLAQGVDIGNYPKSTTYSLGLNVTF